jgi:hypothetical protein
MLETSRLSGLLRAVSVLLILMAMGASLAPAISDDPEPIGGKIVDGPEPCGRGAAVAVISDGPDPISDVVRLPIPAEISDAPDPINGVARLPAPGEAINANSDPYHAAIGDGPDPFDPMVICFFDHGLDCVFLACGWSAPVTRLQP